MHTIYYSVKRNRRLLDAFQRKYLCKATRLTYLVNDFLNFSNFYIFYKFLHILQISDASSKRQAVKLINSQLLFMTHLQ